MGAQSYVTLMTVLAVAIGVLFPLADPKEGEKDSTLRRLIRLLMYALMIAFVLCIPFLKDTEDAPSTIVILGIGLALFALMFVVSLAVAGLSHWWKKKK